MTKSSRRRNNRRPKNSNNRDSTYQGQSQGQLTSWSTLNKLCIARIGKKCQLFPDVLDTHAKTGINVNFSGVVTSQATFHINSPASLFGPQINWTGAFADNAPSGMYYLLSSAAAAGSVAPYLNSCVTHIEFIQEFYNAAAVPAYVTLVPSLNPSLSGMVQSQLAEQKNAVQCLVPPTNNSLPVRLRIAFAIADIFGVGPSEVINNQNYYQTAGNLPGLSYYLHTIVSSTDGSTNCAMNTKVIYGCKLRFKSLNPFVTSVPA